MGEADGPADILLTGGAVYRVDAARSWAQAVAVRGDRIAAVGSDAAVRALAGPATRIIDLAGRMLLPGFQDAHVHAAGGGLDRLRCDVTEVRTREGYADYVRGYAAAHPDESWIVGAGWYMDAFPGGVPTAAELDAAVPDRPVFLVNRDHHGAWANSAALRLAGIGAHTPDPADGRIERNAAGQPTGTLQEGAMGLVEAVIPQPDLAARVRGVLEGQRYLHQLGITGWQEAIVGDYPGVPDCYQAYRAAAADGSLTGRVVGALWWDRTRGEEQISELVDRRSGARTGQFLATTVKIMQDGVCENFTAAMLAPYLHRDGADAGLSYLEPGLLRRVITRLDSLGFQVHVHTIGDRAARDTLDAFAAAREANGPNDLRHHIAHIQVVHPDDIPRFRQLGVTANAQPLWACYDKQMIELTLPFLGPERSAQQYPFGSLARAGAQLAIGSDWPVSSPSPPWLLHVAVNRTPPWDVAAGDDPLAAEPLLPDEALDLPTALAAYTAGSAWVNHHDDTGSIEPGYAADLVVLDRNLFEHPAGEIGQAQVELTMAGGRIVYARPGFDA
ncbi:MAG TPA: amidohydrolase [Streptosporangiaceae bacterium]